MSELQALSNDENPQDLRAMLSQFITASNLSREADRIQHQQDISELRSSIKDILEGSSANSVNNSPQTPFPDRRKQTRRTSMFFGSPGFDKNEDNVRSQIQVLQADIVYNKDKELKVSSLEGLQYLAKQIALLSSIYPNRELKIAHMVSYNLRPHVVAAWNSHCSKESAISGIPFKEIMVEDWLSLSNDEVHSILIESARPRTRELYSKELIMFLARGIPQNIDISTDNFSKMFYVPLMKSLNNMLNLHDLLSQETSNHSNNTSKMPSTSYGTKESPGHIQLWIISLANQKDAILQWLGKDELVKHKTVESAVKYIRSKLMEARTHSEANQDLDAKLTPIRYDEVIHTQAESYQRRQINQPTRPLFNTHDDKFSDNRSRSTFSTLHASNNYDDDDDYNEVNDNDDTNASNRYKPVKDLPTATHSLNATADVNPFRSAIAATFRGYCCELFVFGTCTKLNSGCTYDHSAAGQEICINSFVLLSKRELTAHSHLPQAPTPNDFVATHKAPSIQSQFSRSNSQVFTQPRTYGHMRTAYTQGGRAGGRGFGQQRPAAESTSPSAKGIDSALPFLTWTGNNKDNKSIDFLRLFGEYCDVHMKASIGPAFSSVPPAFGPFDIEPIVPVAVRETPLSTIVVQEYLHLKKFWLTEKRTAELQRLSTFSLVWSRLSESSRSELSEDEHWEAKFNSKDLLYLITRIRSTHIAHKSGNPAQDKERTRRIWADMFMNPSESSFTFRTRIENYQLERQAVGLSKIPDDELIIGIINRLDIYRYGELVRNYLSNDARDIAPLPTELSKLWTDIKHTNVVRFKGQTIPSRLESIYVTSTDTDRGRGDRRGGGRVHPPCW
jgi:hypothetical protein